MRERIGFAYDGMHSHSEICPFAMINIYMKSSPHTVSAHHICDMNIYIATDQQMAWHQWIGYCDIQLFNLVFSILDIFVLTSYGNQPLTTSALIWNNCSREMFANRPVRHYTHIYTHETSAGITKIYQSDFGILGRQMGSHYLLWCFDKGKPSSGTDGYLVVLW